MVQYSPLDFQKSEIRLVTLLPGSSRDPIRCTLSTASLDSPPEFTALSYVWGDTSETVPITVDNEPFDATVNLEAALRAIRKRWRRRVLWIDAICINQKDVEEKGVHVPQMGRLYSTAPEVLVWLGPATEEIELFVSWMRAHYRESYNSDAAFWKAFDAGAELSRSQKQNRDWALLQAWEGRYQIMELPYWTRVWTFQECLLPRMSPVCLCKDTEQFQLTTVFDIDNINALRELQSQALERLRALNEEDLTTELKERERWERVTISEITNYATYIPKFRDLPDQFMHLSKLLRITSDRQCFDERDRIFGLYGMVPAVQAAHPPDYTKPVADVMLQAAAYIVNIDRQGRLLWAWFGLRDDRLSDVSRVYPSWMPDFTRTHARIEGSEYSNLHVRFTGYVAAALGRPKGTPCASVEHTTLRLWARRLGTCTVAIRFGNTSHLVLEQIFEFLNENMVEDSLAKTIRKPETLISRVAQVFVAHSLSSPFFTAKQIFEAFYVGLSSGFRALLDGSDQSCENTIVFSAQLLVGKDLLITEDGCFGICVGGAKDGDIVVIPAEAEFPPLVLTPEPSTSADGVNYYKMVGTAIIDGIQDKGELFDQELVEEVAEKDVVEFLIH